MRFLGMHYYTLTTLLITLISYSALARQGSFLEQLATIFVYQSIFK